MAQAKRDENFVPTLIGVSDADGTTPVTVYVDPTTHRMLVDLTGAGSGTVTSVSVVSANGFAGTVATATTTPAITLTTTITGILQGNGTAISAASTTGTGAVVLASSPTLTTPNIGTPSAGTLTNCTGLPISTGVSGLATGIATFLTTPSSANLAAAVTDETGSGALVFANSPTLVTPALGTPSSVTLTNATGLPIATGVSGLGTGVATALAVNVGTAGAFVVLNGAGGTPSSLTLTNATGLPIVGGTTGTLSVARGGTGRATSTTAYGLIAAGTTATGAHQTLATGATTQILVGGGASALPVWTTASGTGAPLRQGSPTITTPVIAQINDTNGNEQVVFTATGSAVNYLGVTNSATGNGITIASAGGDANIDLNLAPKGTGLVVMTGGDGFDAGAHAFGSSTETDNGNSGTSDTIDWGAGNFQKSTLTGNVTYTFTAPPVKGRYQLMLVQDGTGSRTATWPASVKWPGGTAPTLSTAASSIDIISFYYDGTNYYGVDSLNFS